MLEFLNVPFRNWKAYLAISVIAHVSFAIQGCLFGWYYIFIGVVLGILGYNVCVSLYIHRTLTHNNFKFTRLINQLLLHCCSLMNFGSAAMSAAVHVTHHKYADTDRDPHSIKNIGMLRFLLKDWGYRYSPDRRKYVTLLKDSDIRKQHEDHMKLGIFGAVFLPFMPVLGFWMINLIFGAVHVGKGKDTSVNAWWLYPLLWGEEAHRTHHLTPGAKRLHKFDMIYRIGQFLSLRSLANGGI